MNLPDRIARLEKRAPDADPPTAIIWTVLDQDANGEWREVGWIKRDLKTGTGSQGEGPPPAEPNGDARPPHR